MSTWSWRFKWLAIFTLNLPVALSLGGGFTQNGGQAGMCAAIAFLWFWANCVGERKPAFASAMTTGGVVVALLQFLPILHIMAGIIGLGVGDPSTIRNGSPLHREFRGFLATLITGGILQAIALAIGWISCRYFDHPYRNLLTLHDDATHFKIEAARPDGETDSL